MADHDYSYKVLFAHPRMVRDLLEGFVGGDWLREVDFCSLERVNDTYVSDDRSRTFCVYDGPNPESIRRAAERNGLPVDRITRVSVLDPYFYR